MITLAAQLEWVVPLLLATFVAKVVLFPARLAKKFSRFSRILVALEARLSGTFRHDLTALRHRLGGPWEGVSPGHSPVLPLRCYAS